MDRIKLSIITVTYNAGKALEKTIKSILEQVCIEKIGVIEYIIKDGKSKDNTLCIAKQYISLFRQKRIDYQIVTEIDNGIYDAMNRGLQLEKGKWVIMLNAGDTFYDRETLSKLNEYLDSNADVLVGGYNRENPSGAEVLYPPDIKELNKNMIFCHQAICLKRSIHARFLYNTKYKYAGDYDLVLRMFLEEKKFQYIPMVISNYDVNGMSAAHMIDTYKEIYKIRDANGVIDGPFDRFVYLCGLAKRIILSIMPQTLRWELVGIIHNRKNKTRHSY